MITIKEAEEILKKEYHIDNFLYVVNDMLLPDFVLDRHEVEFKNNIFESVNQLGYSDKCEVTVFEVILKTGSHNRRVTITQEMFKILRGLGINNAIVAFANADKLNYRFSLLTSKYEFDGEKVVKVLSNPRRYSYSLGYGTKTKTAYDFLIGKGKVNSLDELINRFSVEVVNKQFYSEIAACFTRLVGGQRDGKTFDRELNIYGVTDQNKYAEFAVRLIGRIVFCWFLKEKKSENGVSLIPETLLNTKDIKIAGNYYHDVLEPLFFELLNTSIPRRKGKFAQEAIYNQIPYLNGGLFSPHIDDHYKFSPELQSGQYGLVTIPNDWFDRFYAVLGQYNFTVDENTSYDIELSIDPEMLGRIFENLLAEINPETGENAKKSTGSFYTPRDIVDYMVDSSILEHLKTKTEISDEKLKALISYGKEDDELISFSETEKKSIVNALYSVTVLDPACGSGAFPIGVLQKIVYMLQEIDPDATLWFNKATENVSFLIRKEFEKKFNAGSLDYIRKLTVIQNSIFGIDIQPIAVEIARLRCFLSLVIEEKVYDDEPNRGINPLPNLDFKFIIANTLLSLPHDSDNKKNVSANQMSIFENQEHIDQLKAVREEYFSANDAETKNELKISFGAIQKAMVQEAFTNKNASAQYQALFQWEPFGNNVTNWFDSDWMFGIKDGFDIVIANPPYGVKFSTAEKKLFSHKYPTVPDYESADYFLERSYELLAKNGIVCFIIPNMFLSNQFAKKFRENILQKWGVCYINNLSQSSVFESASIRNAIIMFCKEREKYGQYVKMDLTRFEIKIVKSIQISKELLSDSIDNWLNLTDIDIETKKILQKIRLNAKPLSSLCSISQGLIPYDKYRGHSETTIRNRIWNATYQKDETYHRELQGKDVSRYSLIWNGKDWLSYGEWLAAPRRKEFFTEPRILIREITNPRILSTFTDEEFYNTPSIINCIEFINVHPYYVLAIINSSLMSFYHIKSSPKAGKGLFPKILVSDVRKIPIKIDNRYQDKLVTIVEQLLTSYSKSLDAEIDRLIYKIYGLNEEEIAVVEATIK